MSYLDLFKLIFWIETWYLYTWNLDHSIRFFNWNLVFIDHVVRPETFVIRSYLKPIVPSYFFKTKDIYIYDFPKYILKTTSPRPVPAVALRQPAKCRRGQLAVGELVVCVYIYIIIIYILYIYICIGLYGVWSSQELNAVF